MIEILDAVDWASFGYGAGTLAVSTYVWSARGPVVRLARRVRARLQREADLKRQVAAWRRQVRDQKNKLQRRDEQLRMLTGRVARLQYEANMLAEKDAKWAKYQARKKGVHAPTGQDIIESGDGTVERVDLHQQVVTAVDKRARRLAAARRKNNHQRLDGLGWAGDANSACGRGICALGDGHDGGCTF